MPCRPHLFPASTCHLVLNIGTILHGIRQHLVQFGNLVGHGIINRPLAHFHDETSQNVGVDFGDHLQLLALAVFGFGNGLFDAAEELLIKFLSCLLAHSYLSLCVQLIA